MLTIKNNVVVLNVKRPIIGSKHTGRRQFHADSVGNYWEAIPDLGSEGERLQKALLRKAKAVKLTVKMMFMGAL